MFIKRRRQPENEIDHLLQAAIAARQNAENRLNEAVGGELVDAAIFELKAADLRLNHLMKVSRQDCRAACGQ